MLEDPKTLITTATEHRVFKNLIYDSSIVGRVFVNGPG